MFQMKGQVKPQKKILNEMEISNLSDRIQNSDQKDADQTQKNGRTQ